MDGEAWRAETEADRAVAEQGRSRAAWYEAQAAQAVAGRDEALGAAQAEFYQAREDARVLAAGPGRFGRRAQLVREAEQRRAETAERWRGYYTQLPGERWPDETVAREATSAVDARLAHQLRFCEAEASKAADAAQQAEERTARRDTRREKALGHNELSATRRLELQASAETARAKLAEVRGAMTAGMAPEEVRAIDAVRDTQLKQARALGAARGELAARQARQLQRSWDRGRDRDGPASGSEFASGLEASAGAQTGVVEAQGKWPGFAVLNGRGSGYPGHLTPADGYLQLAALMRSRVASGRSRRGGY